MKPEKVKYYKNRLKVTNFTLGCYIEKNNILEEKVSNLTKENEQLKKNLTKAEETLAALACSAIAIKTETPNL